MDSLLFPLLDAIILGPVSQRRELFQDLKMIQWKIVLNLYPTPQQSLE